MTGRTGGIDARQYKLPFSLIWRYSMYTSYPSFGQNTSPTILPYLGHGLITIPNVRSNVQIAIASPTTQVSVFMKGMNLGNPEIEDMT